MFQYFPASPFRVAFARAFCSCVLRSRPAGGGTRVPVATPSPCRSFRPRVLRSWLAGAGTRVPLATPSLRRRRFRPLVSASAYLGLGQLGGDACLAYLGGHYPSRPCVLRSYAASYSSSRDNGELSLFEGLFEAPKLPDWTCLGLGAAPV